MEYTYILIAITVILGFLLGYKNARLKEEIEAYDEHLDAQHSYVRKLSEELDVYKQLVVAKDRVLDDVRAERIKLDNELVESRNANEKLKVKLLKQCAECEALRTKCDTLEAELAKVNDPEVQRIVNMRKQLKQDNDAANLLYNYNQEIAYGMVSATDLTRMEGDDR